MRETSILTEPNYGIKEKKYYFNQFISGSNLNSPEDLLQFVIKSLEGSTFECTLCPNFKAVRKGLVRNHLESIHFPGTFTYYCDYCNKPFGGKNALAVHKSSAHKVK